METESHDPSYKQNYFSKTETFAPRQRAHIPRLPHFNDLTVLKVYRTDVVILFVKIIT